MAINLNKALSFWGISEFVVFKVVESNEERIIYFIRSDGKEYVLKVFESGHPKGFLEKDTAVLEFLGRNEKKISPKLMKTIGNEKYIKVDDNYMFLMEYIKGAEVSESIQDEFKLGQTAARLHLIENCTYGSGINVYKQMFNMYGRFENFSFKEEYDEIIDILPDFTSYKNCFIHTDIAPHNAIKTEEGEIIFIDFDDAGVGPMYIDLGLPLIVQCVCFKDILPGQVIGKNDKPYFKYEAAKAFYEGYYSVTPLSSEEKELIYYGAIFMHLIYMASCPDEEAEYRWAVLKYAINNKDELMSALL